VLAEWAAESSGIRKLRAQRGELGGIHQRRGRQRRQDRHALVLELLEIQRRIDAHVEDLHTCGQAPDQEKGGEHDHGDNVPGDVIPHNAGKSPPSLD
jgi:hypothetical protein